MKDLASRAKKRFQNMPTPKTEEDIKAENQDFSFFEAQLYKELTQEDVRCN